MSTRFDPAEHGFRFHNDFPDAIMQAPSPHDWRLRIDGRSGGMVYAALDYARSEEHARPDDVEPPPDGDILADYIALRQRDAFAGVAAELVMAAQVEGVAAELSRACRAPDGAELRALSERLVTGRPCPLGLVPVPEALAPDAEGRGHHVLALELRDDGAGGAQVLVYDPDRPGEPTVLRRQPEGDGWLRTRSDGSEPRPFAAWFVDRGYAPRVPDIRDAHDEVIDLSHRDLRKWEPPPKQDLQDYRLAGADLRGHAGLSSLDLQGVDARGALLDEAVLMRCDLRESDLREASLRGTDLEGSTLARARLDGADLGRARLVGVVMRQVHAPGMRAASVEIAGTMIEESMLEDAVLTEATMTMAVVSRVRLHRARLDHAAIRKSDLFDVEACDASLVQASIVDTRFDGGSDFRGASLAQATLRDVRFVGADFRGADLSGATLNDVDFRFADLRGASFSNARLHHVNLTGATCDGTRFAGAMADDMILSPDVLALLRSQGVSVKVEQLVVRTARSQIGGPACSLHGGRHGLFAVRPGDRRLWRWDGHPHAWTLVGPPGADFAVTDDGVFSSTPRQDAVLHRDGDQWVRIGGPTRRMWSGGLGLFVEIPGSGELFRWDGTPHRWTRVSGPARCFAVTDADLFRLSLGADVVQRWTGGDGWEPIGGPATTLWAGGWGLFAARPPEDGIWRWDGEPERWSQVCEASAALAVGDDELYRLTPLRDEVQRVLGSSSLTVGGPAREIMVAGEGLFALSHRTGDVWRLV